jgi:hypothetical protein
VSALNEKTLAQWENFAAGCKPGSRVGLLLGGYASRRKHDWLVKQASTCKAKKLNNHEAAICFASISQVVSRRLDPVLSQNANLCENRIKRHVDAEGVQS